MSVAPIRFGTGTRVKIIESMAHGCPVVTTTPGFDGIDAAGGEDLVIGDGADGLADACVGLLEDRALLARVGAAGRMLAESRFDRRTEHVRLVRVLGELIGDGRTRTEVAA
jgi:glycosyltransferase involved in cell wall biosynthesis